MSRLQEGEVVAVYRKCRVCGQLKRLEHFLLRTRGRKIADDVKVCARCRRLASIHA